MKGDDNLNIKTMLIKSKDYNVSAMNNLVENSNKISSLINSYKEGKYVSSKTIDGLIQKGNKLSGVFNHSIATQKFYASKEKPTITEVQELINKFNTNATYINSGLDSFVTSGVGIFANSLISADINVRNVGINTWSPQSAVIEVSITNTELLETVTTICPTKSNQSLATGDIVAFSKTEGILMPSKRGVYSIIYKLKIDNQEVMQFVSKGLNIVLVGGRSDIK
ncbi:MAG: hypothetical protein RR420_00725 [Anaerovoracaceae bacterium]